MPEEGQDEHSLQGPAAGGSRGGPGGQMGSCDNPTG